ncbi:hypothetical protein MLD52_02260 [Puniceicoccaceae bacterium K14]|nr:hypothetical protein [Puniceicoccaceae bacterium K14]
MKLIHSALICTLALSTSLAASNREETIEKAVKSLKEGIELIEAGNLDDGSAEVRWGLDLIDKAKQGEIDNHMIDEVGDFVGGEVTKNKMMGMSVTERTYTFDGVTIKVTLTRQTADSDGGFMQGLGNIAKMGLMQGEPVRIGGCKGSAIAQGSETTITLGLAGDALLAFSSRNATLDKVVGFAEEYPVREINGALSD